MEKDIREEYAGSMWGFSWKRFFVTLGVAVGVWVVSGIVQLIIQEDTVSGLFSFGGSCEITGYPIALCISSNNQMKFILISITNIILWFWVIHLFWNWFEKRHN